MKKNLFVWLGGLLLFGGMTLGATPNLGKSFATSIAQKVAYTRYGNREIPSPTFLFTGAVPEGATTLKITWQGESQSGFFTIKMDNWAEFSLHFRLGYGNIAPGKNHYKLTFREGERLRGIGFLDVETHFQERVFGDATLYRNELEMTSYTTGAWIPTYVIIP
jgi:hypothetical protein